MSTQCSIPRLSKPKSINIFIGNLQLDVTENELKQEFLPYGEIESAHIMNDGYIGSGQNRGYGYVAMAVRAQGEAAIMGLDGKMLHNRLLNVLEALPSSPVTSSIPARCRSRQRK